MRTYRSSEQIPPEPRPVADGVVERFEGALEVDPLQMLIFPQHEMPMWDSERIASSRHDYFEWMHGQFAARLVSATELKSAPRVDLANDCGEGQAPK